MQAKATAKMMRVSPRKVRLLLNEMRGKRVEEAMTLLRFSGVPSARDVAKIVRSATANAENNLGMNTANLRVVAAWAGPGPTLKRFKPRSRGRVSPILRRTSHVTVVVGDGN
ncbi:MAG: 50S ribosomal protein L22 [Chloroflexi bacterium]|jgi:large subunit ribosomal protein L22|nr:50S ribosomal protein L22 [Chloroflexota bacterium]